VHGFSQPKSGGRGRAGKGKKLDDVLRDRETSRKESSPRKARGGAGRARGNRDADCRHVIAYFSRVNQFAAPRRLDDERARAEVDRCESERTGAGILLHRRRVHADGSSSRTCFRYWESQFSFSSRQEPIWKPSLQRREIELIMLVKTATLHGEVHMTVRARRSTNTGERRASLGSAFGTDCRRSSLWRASCAPFWRFSTDSRKRRGDRELNRAAGSNRAGLQRRGDPRQRSSRMCGATCPCLDYRRR